MPIEERRIAAGGLRFDALEAGPRTGTLVLLLHGFPQSSQCWTQALETLGDAGFHAVAYDQRGYSAGATPEGVESYRISALMSDVARVATALDSPQFHVIGHDWGGTIAWALAAHLPQRLLTVTVLSTPHTLSLARTLRGVRQRLRMAYIPLMQTRFAGEAAFLAARGFAVKQALIATGLPADLAARDVDHILEVGPTGPLNWYRALRLPSDQRPGRDPVPTMYVWGDRDAPIGREAAEDTANHVDGPYHFVELDGGTHWIPDLHWDEIDDLVLDHVTANRAVARRAVRPVRRRRAQPAPA